MGGASAWAHMCNMDTMKVTHEEQKQENIYEK
jgi:hypothetical protein